VNATTDSNKKDTDALASQVAALVEQNKELVRQNNWLKRQLFGQKSEKRVEPNPHQMALGEAFEPPADVPDHRTKQKISYERGVGPKVRPEDCVTESGLRFDDSVPVKSIRLPVLGIEGLSQEDYDIIDIKKTYRLAQRPASYVVLCYEQPVIKVKESEEIKSAITAVSPAPALKRSGYYAESRYVNKPYPTCHRAAGAHCGCTADQCAAKSSTCDGRNAHQGRKK